MIQQQQQLSKAPEAQLGKEAFAPDGHMRRLALIDHLLGGEKTREFVLYKKLGSAANQKPIINIKISEDQGIIQVAWKKGATFLGIGGQEYQLSFDRQGSWFEIAIGGRRGIRPQTGYIFKTSTGVGEIDNALGIARHFGEIAKGSQMVFGSLSSPHLVPKEK